jgi:hypothetical protein
VNLSWKRGSDQAERQRGCQKRLNHVNLLVSSEKENSNELDGRSLAGE